MARAIFIRDRPNRVKTSILIYLLIAGNSAIPEVESHLPISERSISIGPGTVLKYAKRGKYVSYHTRKRFNVSNHIGIKSEVSAFLAMPIKVHQNYLLCVAKVESERIL